MLHILWLIIKLILILLGIVLAFLLLAVLSLLFCPLCYQGRGKKEENLLWGQGRISWLLGAVAVQAEYDNKAKVSYSVRILGVKASAYRKFLNKLRRKKKKQTVPEVKIAEKKIPAPQAGIESVKDTQTISKEQRPRVKEERKEQRDRRSRLADKIQKFSGIPGRIWQRLGNLRCTFKKFCDKIRQTKDFFQDERVKAVIRLVLCQTKRLFGHIRPRKIEGRICFGTGDPAWTGQILGVLGVAYPLYRDSVAIIPDFENSILEGYLFIKGRIYGWFLLRIGLELYRNPDLKAMIQKKRKAK